MTWEFINIELYRLTSDAIIKAGSVGLLPLLPFTKGATIEMIGRCAGCRQRRLPSRSRLWRGC